MRFPLKSSRDMFMVLWWESPFSELREEARASQARHMYKRMEYLNSALRHIS